MYKLRNNTITFSINTINLTCLASWSFVACMYIQVELTLTKLTVYEHYKIAVLYIIEQGCLHLLHLLKLPYSALVFIDHYSTYYVVGIPTGFTANV